MKLTRIETIHLDEHPNTLFVRLHTDEGIVGEGDTYYAAEAIHGYIHERAAPMLLGHDPRDIELHWRRLYEVIAHSVGKGAEMRGLSAIDVALWDILGQATGLPIWRLLGGPSRDRIKTYNTCGGPSYGRSRDLLRKAAESGKGQYEDLLAFMTDAGELASELLEEGISGMKIWPFDFVAHSPNGWTDWLNSKGTGAPDLRNLGGQRISNEGLQQALAPVRQIREAVGNRMDLMIEGHGYWSLPAAKKIARALEEYEPFWLEDLMRADDVGALAELQRSTSTPVLASEYLTTRWEYLPLLQQRAADMIMIDPTWAGGITESKKIATMAETFKRPVSMHDCTGPLTLMAGIHLAINAPNAIYQESVRAFLRVTYPELVNTVPQVEDGHFLAPTEAGLGAALLPEVLSRPDAHVRTSSL